MSKFKVKIQNNLQNQEASLQQTIYVAGPKGVRRSLKDGEIFEDCNYWKKFSFPTVPLEESFIEVLEDDGTIYSDIEEENIFPRVYTNVIEAGSSFEENKINIFEDNFGYAKFVQLNSFEGSGDIKVRINGTDEAIFNLDSGNTQQFNYGDIIITKLEFKNEGNTSATIQTILSVKCSPKS